MLVNYAVCSAAQKVLPSKVQETFLYFFLASLPALLLGDLLVGEKKTKSKFDKSLILMASYALVYSFLSHPTALAQYANESKENS